MYAPRTVNGIIYKLAKPIKIFLIINSCQALWVKWRNTFVPIKKGPCIFVLQVYICNQSSQISPNPLPISLKNTGHYFQNLHLHFQNKFLFHETIEILARNWGHNSIKPKLEYIKSIIEIEIFKQKFLFDK